MDTNRGLRPAWLERVAHRWHSLHQEQGSRIDAYRGMVDASGTCTLHGRVLERPAGTAPTGTEDWWDNLVSSFRRYDSEHMPGVKVEVAYRGQTVTAITDAQGYYQLAMQVGDPAGEGLWETAEVRLADGSGKPFKQPVMCVPGKAAFGLISDIDDTVLQGNGSRWQAAFQTTLLSNARTRKPLEGVGQLYQAFQQGRDGSGPNPVFYVSAGPWNMYELLVDFMEINGLPPGPILLRDVDLTRASLLHHAGPLSKLSRIHAIIDRYPALKFVLVGDSAQLDAELYAQTVEKYPGRILAVYIRDIDPDSNSPRDQFVDSHIERVAGSKVPMLRVANSNAIAEHARSLGLIASDEITAVAKDVAKDQAAPAGPAAS